MELERFLKKVLFFNFFSRFFANNGPNTGRHCPNIDFLQDTLLQYIFNITSNKCTNFCYIILPDPTRFCPGGITMPLLPDP